MNRKEFIKNTGLLVAGAMTLGVGACSRNDKNAEAANPLKDITPSADGDFPLHDLHIHASATQPYELIARRAADSRFDYYGIMMNGTRPVPATDESIERFLADTAPLGCYRGMQNMRLGWSKKVSPEAYKGFDYFFMDPQVVPDGNAYGDTLEIWEHDCYIADINDFMDRNLKHYEAVLTADEPLDIFGWPLYLPPCIGRFYDKVWTPDRLTHVIDLIKARGVAVEINDFAHTPHEEFIVQCKRAGLKFVFGSDSRDHRSFRLDFCKDIARRCGLTTDDFWRPEHKA